MPVGSETTAANLTAPFARTLTPTGGSSDAEKGITENAWKGFRNLSATEINNLATEMVMQVRKRGPFLSMADFVNRRLATPASDTYNRGLNGALQAALDASINLQTNVTNDGSHSFQGKTATGQLAEDAYILPTRLSGFPGYLLQADVLSPLAPVLSARSDTFTIRTYGDVINPLTRQVEGRAWCEAVVQRTPDYTVPKSAGGNDPCEIPAAGSSNATFGRHYQVVAFRWLNPNDI